MCASLCCRARIDFSRQPPGLKERNNFCPAFVSLPIFFWASNFFEIERKTWDPGRIRRLFIMQIALVEYFRRQNIVNFPNWLLACAIRMYLAPECSLNAHYLFNSSEYREIYGILLEYSIIRFFPNSILSWFVVLFRPKVLPFRITRFMEGQRTRSHG